MTDKLAVPVKPIRVEILGLLPTLFSHCSHCMESMEASGVRPYDDQLAQYPEEVRNLHWTVSELTHKLVKKFNGLVRIHVVDTASPEGLWQSLKHHVRKTPCIIVDGRKAFESIPPFEKLEAKVSEHLRPSIRKA